MIAIDGPAASGKSTTARLVAQQLGWIYVDTGAMYRGVTLFVLQHNIVVDDRDAVARASAECKISFSRIGVDQHVFLNGEDVTIAIRSAEVTLHVSTVSSYAEVRTRLVEQQRAFAQQGSVVMDGRDIGTVVFPNADLKFFLIASIDERARRRCAELDRAGTPANFEIVRAQIAERDRLDASREASPLRKADDAIELDTTNLSIDDQVQFILSLVKSISETPART